VRFLVLSVHKSRALLLVACLLLLIAASRILRLDGLTMNPDEVWSVWQTFGTPAQIVAWTPYDWPPGYYLTLGAWRALDGQSPLILRYLSVLAFMIGAAGLYRVVRRLYTHPAGVVAALAYAALGYGILLSIEVRGYALLLGLMPLAFWCTVRYFDHPKPLRALPLALLLAAMFYVSVTSIGAFLMLGIYTLIVYGRQIWRWWLPGLIAGGLALPEILNKFQLGITRIEATQLKPVPPFPQALIEFFNEQTGYVFLLWVGLFLLGTIFVLRRWPVRRVSLALLAWAVGALVLMYVLQPVLAFFSVRYAWWIMLGVAAWLGVGLSRLPRLGMAVVALVFLGLMFTPIPTQEYSIFDNLSPLEANFRWLADHVTSGDVFVADPSMGCGKQEEWDFYLRTYFPTGLPFVDDFEGYRRVWYITADGRQDPALKAALEDGRVAGRFVGPPECLFRLYQAPPDREGILYENGMRFHGVEVMDGERPWTAPLVRREGESVRFRLWWSVDAPVDLDYSVGTYLLWSDASIAAQADSAPQVIYPEGAPAETSRWTPGQFYIEERTMTLPFPTPRTLLGMDMAVYFWADNVRLAAPGVDENGALRLFNITVMSY
jgi:hypothetical protein